MGLSVCLSVCVVCEQILVIKYDVMLKDMSPPATSKRHVVYVVVM